MKKLIAFFVAVTFVVSAFAIDMSVGGNVEFTHNWNYVGGTFAGEDGGRTTSLDYIGFNAFFDAQYVRLTFGPNFSVGKKKTKTKPAASSDGLDSNTPTYTNLNIGILGKYPFEVGIAKIFPMAGFDFSFNVSVKSGETEMRKIAAYGKKEKQDLNHYYFVVGLGADIKVVGNLFVTPTAILGIDLRKPSGYKATKKVMKASNLKYSDNTFIANIGLGFGYKL